MSSGSNAAVIGGGISGLAAAYYLNRQGIRPLLIERAPRLGGVIETTTIDGCVVEGGPDSFLAAKPEALELIRELGLEDQVIASNDHQRVTYIWRRGRLLPLPDGLMMMIPTRFAPLASSPLLSWPGKLRMAFDFAQRPGPRPERTVAAFFRAHFGQEAVEYLAEPLLSGVYGGDINRLSAPAVLGRFTDLEERHGSLIRGLLAARRSAPPTGPLFRTLRGGLGQLVNALEISNTFDRLTGTVEAIEPGFRLRVDGQWLETSRLVIACPAWEAARLLSSFVPDAAEGLAEVEYTSSVTVALGYRPQDVRHPMRGFGFLVPKRENRQLLACTWVGRKFDHRVPAERVLLRCFLGGQVPAGDNAVLEAVHSDLALMMGLTAEPLFHRVSRLPRSMAQYTLGHGSRIDRVRNAVAQVPGLALAGNAYLGIGLPDCIRTGRLAAESLARRA